MKINKMYNLTALQKGILFDCIKDNSNTNYCEHIRLLLKGCLDIPKLERSLNNIIDRYDVLRTIIIYKKISNPQQVVLLHRTANIVLDNITGLAEEEVEDELNKIISHDKEMGIDITRDIPIRIRVIAVKENEFIIQVTYHHILIDGWSISIIINDLMDCYSKNKLDKQDILQFGDYVKWIDKQESAKFKKYWKKELGDIDHMVSLEEGSLTVSRYDNIYRKRCYRVDKEIIVSLMDFAKDNQITINSVLIGLWGVLLQKYCNSKDVIFGISSSGRSNGLPNIENSIGLFLNVIPIRFINNQINTLLDEVKKIHSKTYEREKNSYISFPQLYHELGLETDMIQCILNIENFPMDEILSTSILGNGSFSNLEISDITIDEKLSYDFDISIFTNGEINVQVTFNKSKFSDNFVDKMYEAFSVLMKNVKQNSCKKISKISILPEGKTKSIINKFAGDKVEVNYAILVPDRIEAIADKYQNKIAITCDDDILTYKQLNDNANKIARMFTKSNLGKEDKIALILDRSLFMMECILAMWKIGAVYIPIDRDYPLDRIYTMIDDAKIDLIICETNMKISLSFTHGVKIFTKEALLEACCKNNTSNLNFKLDENNLAYIIYTSGSSGKPKGAMIEHKGMLNHLISKTRELEINFDGVIIQNASHCFDISIWQMFAALINGGKTVIYTNETVLNINSFIDHLFLDRPNILEVVPSFLAILTEQLVMQNKKLDFLKYLLTTGEAVSVNLVNEALKIGYNIKIVNAYGPTEASDDITHMVMSENLTYNIVPIGHAIQNMTIFILDSDYNICPIGVKGEICVSGDGVGRGYINNEAKTDELFISNPYGTGITMYKTGDIGYWLPDGNIVFVGRKDNQVKIRGFRIEIDEIEKEFGNIEQIHTVVILEMEMDDKKKCLVAFYKAKAAIKKDDIINYLKNKIPYYMIPTFFEEVSEFPLTSNGKIDRKKLKSNYNPGKESLILVEACNEVEEKLLNIWKRTFSQEIISVVDNFFNLGGHSLMMISIIAEVNREFHMDISINEFVDNASIKDLAVYINKKNQCKINELKKAEEKPSYHLSSAQRRMYFLNQIDKKSTNYNMPFAAEITGDIDVSKFENIFRIIIDRHEILRTKFSIVEDLPMQLIQEKVDFRILELDYSNVCIGPLIQPFDLHNDMLIRVAIIRKSSDKNILFIDMHHIVSDDVSIKIMIDEFVNLYNSGSLGKLEYQYKDYAQWQYDMLKNNGFSKEEDYWMKVFDQHKFLLNLPYDFEKKEDIAKISGKECIVIEKDLFDQMTKFVISEKTTMFTLVLSIYSILLVKYCNADTVVVGVPTIGRRNKELMNMIGVFINTLPIKININDTMQIIDVIKGTNKAAFQAYENQDFPLDELVSKLNIDRSYGENPLFNTMLVQQSNTESKIELNSLQFQPLDLEHQNAKIDLELMLLEEKDKVTIDFIYIKSLFLHNTITAMCMDFLEILNQTINNKNLEINKIKILNEMVKKHKLEEIKSSLDELECDF